MAEDETLSVREVRSILNDLLRSARRPQDTSRSSVVPQTTRLFMAPGNDEQMLEYLTGSMALNTLLLLIIIFLMLRPTRIAFS